MDHREAIQLGAVEKYLLNELAPGQRTEFEEHFFDCQECAADLRMTAEFLDTARKELGRGTIGGTASRTLKRSWLELFARPAVLAPVLTLLMAVIVYQNAVVLPRFNGEIAQLRRPGVVSTISLIGANSRGGSAPMAAPASQPLVLSLDIPAAESFSSYVCVLLNSAGAPLWQVSVSQAQARDTVSITVPAGDLRPGDYTLVVQGLTPRGRVNGSAETAATDVARYRFTLTPAN